MSLLLRTSGYSSNGSDDVDSHAISLNFPRAPPFLPVWMLVRFFVCLALVGRNLLVIELHRLRLSVALLIP
jgi:hypothetical protein